MQLAPPTFDLHNSKSVPLTVDSFLNNNHSSCLLSFGGLLPLNPLCIPTVTNTLYI